MHIELSQDDAAALRDLLQQKVRELDKEINRADSLRFKGELRVEEHCFERILGALTTAIDQGVSGPRDWEERDNIPDE
jgi:hypothetical protein